MRQVNKKREKDKVAAVLMLCFCLIALISIFTIKASIDKISNSTGNIPVTKKAAVEENKTDQSKNKESKAEKSESQETAAHVPTVDSAEEASKLTTFISPIDKDSGKIIKKYSMDMIIYNVTLDQYMTHPGMDITAPKGEMVKSVADGTVTDIYTDDAYGTTIEVTHNNGYVSRYCNLATKVTTEKGNVVKQGQAIGKIGRTAMYESMEEAHVHLEILKDGKLCSPNKIIEF